jgi:hypothetical protein
MITINVIKVNRSEVTGKIGKEGYSVEFSQKTLRDVYWTY